MLLIFQLLAGKAQPCTFLCPSKTLTATQSKEFIQRIKEDYSVHM